MADQMRADVLDGGLGPDTVPNLQQLAAEGFLFDSAYSSTPSCTPARAALLTGQSPWQHGMLGYATVAPTYPVEMPSFMAQEYATASIGKDHFGWFNNSGVGHGYSSRVLYDGLGNGFSDGEEYDNYDQWFQNMLPGADPLATGKPLMDWNSWRGAPYVYNETFHPTAWVGRQAVNFLESYDRVAHGDKPFFLKVSFHRPHSPYDPPARLLNASIARGQLPPPRVCIQGAAGEWDARYRPASAWCGPQDQDAWCGDMPANAADLGRHAYRASTTFVDEWIGRILSALERRGLTEATWIVFTADHGDSLGDHFLHRKCEPNEGSAKIPLVVRPPANYTAAHGSLGPGSDPLLRPIAPRGSTITGRLAEVRDIFPTVADVANMPFSPSYPSPPSLSAGPSGLPLTCLMADPSGDSCWPVARPPWLHANGAPTGPTHKATDDNQVVTEWRAWLDLEHDTCYNASNHWSAVIRGDGMKFVFYADLSDGRQHLFNVTADPYELVNLADRLESHATLVEMRELMARQFEVEERGPRFVQDGALVLRPSITYSPFYPRAPGPSPADRLYVEACGAAWVNESTQYWALGDGSHTNVTASAEPLSLRIQGANSPAGSLCLTANSSARAVGVGACTAGDAAQLWRHATKSGPVVHAASGMCLALTSSAQQYSSGVVLQPCSETARTQSWLLGTAGLLYANLSQRCLTATTAEWVE